MAPPSKRSALRPAQFISKLGCDIFTTKCGGGPAKVCSLLDGVSSPNLAPHQRSPLFPTARADVLWHRWCRPHPFCRPAGPATGGRSAQGGRYSQGTFGIRSMVSLNFIIASSAIGIERSAMRRVHLHDPSRLSFRTWLRTTTNS
jgi:hypothetical protein